MKYIREINNAAKVNYICGVCNLISKDETYHLIDFGSFNWTLCDNCYKHFKEVIDKED